MNRKTFAFGLGAGLLVACAIFFIAYAVQSSVWNREERTLNERIAALSATPAPTLSPPAQPTVAPTEKPTETPTEAPTEEPTETPTEEPTEAPTEAPTETPTEEPTEAPTETPTEKPSATPKPTESAQVILPPGMVSVFIPRGSTATTVAKLLSENGVIDGSAGYVDYLIENGLTKKLVSGTYTFKLFPEEDFASITAKIREP
ncbi:hypothetical protein FACS189490_10080 [Clostridia bacterium]|nr:hypothetical protein FACS189490_10080 [Clostridia bacterium]